MLGQRHQEGAAVAYTRDSTRSSLAIGEKKYVLLAGTRAKILACDAVKDCCIVHSTGPAIDKRGVGKANEYRGALLRGSPRKPQPGALDEDRVRRAE